MPRKRWNVEPFVFVIESPSSDDLVEERAEGEALTAALGPAGIRTKLFRPYNLEMLAKCLTKALDEVEPPARGKGDTLFLPSLHFSAHGSKEGLQFTSGEFLRWEGLRKVLLKVAKAIGLFHPTGEYAMLAITLSTCSGASASQMFSRPRPYPCIYTVGPDARVTWADSLTAFIVFYHHILQKNSAIHEAVNAMNRGAGLRAVFRYEMNPAAIVI